MVLLFFFLLWKGIFFLFFHIFVTFGYFYKIFFFLNLKKLNFFKSEIFKFFFFKIYFFYDYFSKIFFFKIETITLPVTIGNWHYSRIRVIGDVLGVRDKVAHFKF